MDAALKAKWVAALRSGNYQQGRGVLRNGKGEYCCLGVLCETYGLQHETRGKATASHFTFPGEDFEMVAFLSPSALEAFELSDYKQKSLSFLNDSDRRSFSEIADWIEANL